MPETKEEKLTLTVLEAAITLGIGRNLAYVAAKQGKIPSIRFGRRLLIRRKALERLLENPPPLCSSSKGLIKPSKKVLKERLEKKTEKDKAHD